MAFKPRSPGSCCNTYYSPAPGPAPGKVDPFLLQNLADVKIEISQTLAEDNIEMAGLKQQAGGGEVAAGGQEECGGLH